MKLTLLVLWAAVSTAVRLLVVDAPLFLIGLPLIALEAENTIRRESELYPGRMIRCFAARGMWLWNNEEDGVDGLRGGELAQAWWAQQTAGWSWWRRIFVWSAIRNSVNNLRQVPLLSPRFVPSRIKYQFNNWLIHPVAPPQWPTGSAEPICPLINAWAVAWQGPYVGVYFQYVNGLTGSFGWNLKPGDNLGALYIADRAPRARLTVDLKKT